VLLQPLPWHGDHWFCSFSVLWGNNITAVVVILLREACYVHVLLCDEAVIIISIIDQVSYCSTLNRIILFH
jgi:hypothetical protein